MQQGQGVEQAGDELGGHVPRQGVHPGGELSPDGEGAVLLFIGDALLPEDGEIGLLGPLHQATVAGEHAAAPDGQGHRNEEPEGGAALAAVQPGERAAGGRPARQAGDRQLVPLLPDNGPQGLQTADGGLDVLGEGHVGEVAGAVGQGGGQKQPWGLGLGRGRRDSTVEQGWRYGDIHFSSQQRGFGHGVGHGLPRLLQQDDRDGIPSPLLVQANGRGVVGVGAGDGHRQTKAAQQHTDALGQSGRSDAQGHAQLRRLHHAGGHRLAVGPGLVVPRQLIGVAPGCGRS